MSFAASRTEALLPGNAHLLLENRSVKSSVSVAGDQAARAALLESLGQKMYEEKVGRGFERIEQ